MASRKGYTSLPVDSETGNAEAEQSGAGISGSTYTGAVDSSVRAEGDATSGRDATSGSGTEKETPGAEKAGESAGKDAAADPTGERSTNKRRHLTF